MANVEIKVPDLGVEKAIVNEIMVKVGESVAENDSIVLVESDKATVEIPSSHTGVVQAIHIQEGDTVQEGVLLLTLSQDKQPIDEQARNAPPSDKQPSEEAAATQPPQAQLSQTDSPPAQTVVELEPATPASRESDSDPVVYAGPAVRKLARQLGVRLAQVEGSALNQRIVKEDVFAYVQQKLSQPAAAGVSSIERPALSDYRQFGGGEFQSLSSLQQAAIRHLALNQQIPQVTQFDQADISDLETWRKSLLVDFAEQGTKLTLLSFVVKAVAYLLQEEPLFRAHLADDGQSIFVRNEIHLGIAVATEAGLVVPVLREPDKKTIRQIAQELQQLSDKARNKKLSPIELQGANFTITSLGGVGGTAFTPLVSSPEVAILGLSPAQMQPVWNGQNFEPRLMLPLSLSYDHRVINGVDAARFTQKLTHTVMDIRRTLL